MITVISPAKKLDMTAVDGPRTQPKFQQDANTLAGTARQLKVADLQKLMHISENLAQLNAERFKSFEASSTEQNATQAMYIFAGDTYTGLEARSLDADEVRFAQDHLRILSGLYGVLRPLDAIQPYRLEMGSRLKTKRGKSLYEYWGDRIANELNETGAETLLNCASQEYFGAVDQNALRLKLITPTFLEDKPGGPKIVSFFAKKARGAMARFVIQNRIRDPKEIRDFDIGGYTYQPHLSSDEKPVFLRSDATAQPLKEAS